MKKPLNKKPLQFADLATAQEKARTGQKLTRADINALARESDRLQDLAIARWKAEQR